MENTNINEGNIRSIKTKNVLPQQQLMYADPNNFHEQRKKQKENLERKDYLLTVYQSGDEVMSAYDKDKQVLPRRFFQRVSLLELSKILETIEDGFWEHPDLKPDFSNRHDIPSKERKYGVITNIIVSPLSEELEKTYVESSENAFFENQRSFYAKDFSKEVDQKVSS